MELSFPVDSVLLTIDKNADYSIAPIYSTPRLQINETEFAITIDGVAKYRVKDGSQVWVSPHNDADQSSIQLFLNGSVFGAVLHQRGIVPFHGCSFEYEGKGILICGRSGVGKSSVTAAFCKTGANFINDDITPVSIDEYGGTIIPIRTQMKLWDDSLKVLEIENEGFKKIRPSLQKFYVPFSNVCGTKISLSKIVVIGTHEKDDYGVSRPTGMVKYNLLRKNIYREMYLRGMPQTARNYFKKLIKLTEAIDVILILRPRVCDVCSTVEFIRKQL